MKISANTLEILKNFSKINANFISSPGNVIKTVASSKAIYAEARITESIPGSFSIFDLGRFLATIGLFKDPDFTFESNLVEISSGDFSIRYCYSDPALTKDFAKNLPPSIKLPVFDYEFYLSEDNLQSLLDASKVMSLPDLAVEANKDGIFLKLLDKKDKNSNTYTLRVGDNTKNFGFNMFFKVENLKMLSDNYTVKISQKKASQFVNKDGSLFYLIAMEHDSTW
jgi:hypothetical protein